MSNTDLAKSDSITLTGLEDADTFLLLPPSLHGHASVVDLFEHLLREGLVGDHIEKTSILQGEILQFGIALSPKKKSIDSRDKDAVNEWLKKYEQLEAIVDFQFDEKEPMAENRTFSLSQSFRNPFEYLLITSVSADSRSEIAIEKHVYDETKVSLYLKTLAEVDGQIPLRNPHPCFVLFTFSIPTEFNVNQIGRPMMMRIIFNAISKIQPQNNITTLGNSSILPDSTFAVTQGASIYFTKQLQANLRAPTIFNSQIPWSSALTYRPHSVLTYSNAFSSESVNENNAKNESKPEIGMDLALAEQTNLKLELLALADPLAEHFSTMKDQAVISSSHIYGTIQIHLRAVSPLKIRSQRHRSYVSLLFTNCTTDTTIQIQNLDVPEFELLFEHELPFTVAPSETYGVVLQFKQAKQRKAHYNVGALGIAKSLEDGAKWNADDTGKENFVLSQSIPITIAWGIDKIQHMKLWSQTSFTFRKQTVNLLEATVIGLQIDEKEIATNAKISFLNNSSIDMELLVYCFNNIHSQRYISSDTHPVGICPAFIMLSYIEKTGLLSAGHSRAITLRYIRTHCTMYELPPLFIFDSCSSQWFLLPGMISSAS